MSEPAFWTISESEWLTSSDADRLSIFAYYKFKSSRRKLSLLYSACLRRIWHLLTDQRCYAVIEVVERSADGFVGEEEYFAAHRAACDGWGTMAEIADEGNYSTPLQCAMPDAGLAAYQAIDGDAQCIKNASSAAASNAMDRPVLNPTPAWNSARVIESQKQIRLMHDIFGNPFHPVTLEQTWLTTNATALAQAIYDECRFERMPILGDALED